jgi:nucleotide-binding universal stress UspA family protein
MPLKKVLIAIDDSKAALHAFLEALALDRRFGCRLIAVGVAPVYEGDLSLVGVRDLKATLNQPVLSVLEEAVRIVEEEGLGLTTYTARGDRSEAILDLAARESCDLIVLGQEPRFLRKVWNSLTASLLRRSPVDILIIPNQRPLRFDSILCAEDACPFFPLIPETAMAFSSEAANHFSALPSPLQIHKGLLTEITKAAQAMGADLIVLRGDDSQGTLKRLTGSVAYRIVRAAPCPVWVVKRSDTGRIPI